MAAKKTSADLQSQADKLMAQAKELRAQAQAARRKEERDRKRREQERIHREAVALIEHSRTMSITVNGKPLSVYEWLVESYEDSKRKASRSADDKRSADTESGDGSNHDSDAASSEDDA